MKALEVQGVSRDSLPYKAPFQPYGAWFALGATGLIAFFKGFDAFIPKLSVEVFVPAYIGIPIFIVLIIYWRLRFRESTVPLAEMDLLSGKREIDEQEKRWIEEQALLGPRTRWQKIWDGL